MAPRISNGVRLVRRARRPARRGRARGRTPIVLGLLASALVLPIVALAVVGAVVLGMLAPLSSQQQGQPNAAACGVDLTGPPAAYAASSRGLDSEQLRNAATIIATAKRLGVPAYGWVVALATAMQESGLRDLRYGDRDSLGLFQQRSAWGSVSERTDPATAATMFFHGGRNGTREPGLLDIDGWERMPVTEAAQAVQRSAFPDAYGQWESLARGLVGQLADASSLTSDCGPGSAMNCPDSPWPDLERGLKPDALLVLRCLHQEFPRLSTFYGVHERVPGGDGDHAAGRAVDAMLPYDHYRSPAAVAFGWRVAHWVKDHRRELGVKYVIFDDRIWSVAHADEGWRRYTHYAGCTTDTCLHYDHVHVSVYGNAASGPATGDWVLPVAPGGYTLTAGFGECGSRWAACHTGQDFAAPVGTPIHAAAAGTVTFAGRDGPYGNLIVIDNGNGVETYYAHQSRFAPHVLGQRVRPGEVIGYVGATGNTTGPHVHFEVRIDGTPRDPLPWLTDHGLRP